MIEVGLRGCGLMGVRGCEVDGQYEIVILVSRFFAE
jgi:hypothetical protein